MFEESALNQIPKSAGTSMPTTRVLFSQPSLRISRNLKRFTSIGNEDTAQSSVLARDTNDYGVGKFQSMRHLRLMPSPSTDFYPNTSICPQTS
jgi:hypothetical protein